MGADDAVRWDGRYSNRDATVIAAPPDALIESGLIERTPTDGGTALDIACGLGAQTIWLAQRGLDVTSLDVSSKALQRVSAAAREHGVSERVTTRLVDLDDGIPSDLSGFGLIVCQRFRDPGLYTGMVQRLDPRGLLVVTVLSATGASNPGAFHAPGGELRAAFDRNDCTVLHHREGEGQESIIVERNA